MKNRSTPGVKRFSIIWTEVLSLCSMNIILVHSCKGDTRGALGHSPLKHIGHLDHLITSNTWLPEHLARALPYSSYLTLTSLSPWNSLQSNWKLPWSSRRSSYASWWMMTTTWTLTGCPKWKAFLLLSSPFYKPAEPVTSCWMSNWSGKLLRRP